MERVSRFQSELIKRTDKLLQRLMESHDPLVSNFERKWFEELARIEKEVVRGDRSLEKRVKRLEHQLEVLKPGLEELRNKEGEESRRRWGKSQMKSLEIKLAQE